MIYVVWWTVARFFSFLLGMSVVGPFEFANGSLIIPIVVSSFHLQTFRLSHKVWEVAHYPLAPTPWGLFTLPFLHLWALPNSFPLRFKTLDRNLLTALYRRPSGIPREDYDGAAGAEARVSLVPQFEQKYLEVSFDWMSINCSMSIWSTPTGTTANPGEAKGYWRKAATNQGPGCRDKSSFRTIWYNTSKYKNIINSFCTMQHSRSVVLKPCMK